MSCNVLHKEGWPGPFLTGTIMFIFILVFVFCLVIISLLRYTLDVNNVRESYASFIICCVSCLLAICLALVFYIEVVFR